MLLLFANCADSENRNRNDYQDVPWHRYVPLLSAQARRQRFWSLVRLICHLRHRSIMSNESARALLAAAVAGVLALAIAAPASAAVTAATAATVTVSGGALSITAPATAGRIGTITNTVLGGNDQRPIGSGARERRAQRGGGFRLGRDRDLDRVHSVS
jgi:hypothetical protein